MNQEWIPEFVDQPELEMPTLPEGDHLVIEGERVFIAQPGLEATQLAFQEFFRWMELIHRAAGDRLLLMLIPDVFQVDDDLWGELIRGRSDASLFERDSPQSRILRYSEQHGIPTLDLLPILRQAPGRSYHKRDTHLNGPGNRIVGEALAAFTLERLKPVQSSAGKP